MEARKNRTHRVSEKGGKKGLGNPAGPSPCVPFLCIFETCRYLMIYWRVQFLRLSDWRSFQMISTDDSSDTHRLAPGLEAQFGISRQARVRVEPGTPHRC